MSGIDGWGTNKNIWNCLDINCKQKGTLGMAWVYSSRSVELVTTNYVSSTNNVTVSTYVLHLLTVRPYLVYLLSKPGTRYYQVPVLLVLPQNTGCAAPCPSVFQYHQHVWYRRQASCEASTFHVLGIKCDSHA